MSFWSLNPQILPTNAGMSRINRLTMFANLNSIQAHGSFVLWRDWDQGNAKLIHSQGGQGRYCPEILFGSWCSMRKQPYRFFSLGGCDFCLHFTIVRGPRCHWRIHHHNRDLWTLTTGSRRVHTAGCKADWEASSFRSVLSFNETLELIMLYSCIRPLNAQCLGKGEVCLNSSWQSGNCLREKNQDETWCLFFSHDMGLGPLNLGSPMGLFQQCIYLRVNFPFDISVTN